MNEEFEKLQNKVFRVFISMMVVWFLAIAGIAWVVYKVVTHFTS